MPTDLRALFPKELRRRSEKHPTLGSPNAATPTKPTTKKKSKPKLLLLPLPLFYPGLCAISQEEVARACEECTNWGEQYRVLSSSPSLTCAIHPQFLYIVIYQTSQLRCGQHWNIDQILRTYLDYLN